jgi:toxin ParE1/3/4
MVELIWTEPALGDLDAIADYIALDKPDAARELVRRIFKHVERLIEQPESGGEREWTLILGRPDSVSLFSIRANSRPFAVFILHVLRGENAPSEAEACPARQAAAAEEMISPALRGEMSCRDWRPVTTKVTY